METLNTKTVNISFFFKKHYPLNILLIYIYTPAPYTSIPYTLFLYTLFLYTLYPYSPIPLYLY